MSTNTLISMLREDQIQARKNRQSVEASLLTTLISEASMRGKNDGNREPTDAEVIATAKKFLDGVKETMAHLNPMADRYQAAVIEARILTAIMPAQMSEDDLRAAILTITQGVKDQKLMGKVMGGLKAQYGSAYDGALAGKLAKELLS